MDAATKLQQLNDQLEGLTNELLNMERVIHQLVKEQEACPHCSKKWEKNKCQA
jgi:DNA repair exonuclease SbcCD ATPase subunit